jgi:hypothetical protein
VASRDTLGATFGPPWSRHTGRIHVLEAGPFVLPERVQNLPMLGLNQPSPTTIAELRNAGQFGPDKPRAEVWERRTVAISQGEAINEEALVAMFRAIIAHNRAGGWRKIMCEH